MPESEDIISDDEERRARRHEQLREELERLYPDKAEVIITAARILEIRASDLEVVLALDRTSRYLSELDVEISSKDLALVSVYAGRPGPVGTCHEELDDGTTCDANVFMYMRNGRKYLRCTRGAPERHEMQA